METPGSIGAKNLGCVCPEIDNGYGSGAYGKYFWVNEDCPLHGDKAKTSDLRMIKFERISDLRIIKFERIDEQGT